MHATIKQAAELLSSYGLTVYIAKNGQYGFYTDGKRCVSFQLNFGVVSFSGNYFSHYSGTGWALGDSMVDHDKAWRYVQASAPHWAVQGETVSYPTPEQHLQRWATSGYELFLP